MNKSLLQDAFGHHLLFIALALWHADANFRTVSWIRHWLSSFSRRPAAATAAVPPLCAAPPPCEHTIPAFIKAVAQTCATGQTPHHEQAAAGHQDRNPGRALGRLRSRAAGAGAGGRAGARAAADAGTAGGGGLEIFAELEVERFILGIYDLEHRNGAEHDVRFDPVSSRVIKLTQPGEFGAWGGLAEYLQRLAWSNEFFDDDWLVEGWIHYPNEPAPRLVTSQPWYRVRPERPEPALAEIDAYLWRMGWLKAYDGAWIHASREIVISDALSKNFVLDVAGHVQPIDLIILKPSDEQWEQLQHMVRNLPQHS